LTSRVEQPIVTALKTIKAKGHEYRELALDEEDQTDVWDDIELFFEQKLEIIREQRELPPNWPGDERV
jgi:CHASE3 domain sensor protein